MKQTKQSIQAKWDKKLKDITITTQIALEYRIEQLKEKKAQEFERKAERMRKKINSYLKKKEEQYKRKCLNEIRKLEWKEEKIYKKKEPTRNKYLQFALDIAQENAKLRDTNKDWKCKCISCNQIKERNQLAGWHFYGRSYESVCLRPENIHAQCHWCNRTTWPRGDVKAKETTQMIYKTNLERLEWPTILNVMERRVIGERQKPADYRIKINELKELIPQLIEENDTLRKCKTFHKPKKDWKKYYSKHFIQ